MKNEASLDAWAPRCFGRDYIDEELWPDECKPCPFKEDCQLFTEERKFKAVE